MAQKAQSEVPDHILENLRQRASSEAHGKVGVQMNQQLTPEDQGAVAAYEREILKELISCWIANNSPR